MTDQSPHAKLAQAARFATKAMGELTAAWQDGERKRRRAARTEPLDDFNDRMVSRFGIDPAQLTST